MAKRYGTKDKQSTGDAVGAAAYKKLRTIRAPRLKVSVPVEFITTGIVANSGWCMISEAVKVAAPWATHVSSDLQTIRMTDQRKGLRYVYLTPRSVQDALIKFDQGVKPRPFAFKLGGAYIHTSYKKAVDGSKTAKAVHKLGRRRIVPNAAGKRTVPDVVGGSPPRRSAPLGTYRREFGMRAYVGGFTDKVPVGGPSISDK